MHQQIKASPDDTAENFQRIVNALADRGVNILAIAPDFDPPHVRVLVSHDDMDGALSALSDAGLTPEIKSALGLTNPGRARPAEEGRGRHHPPRLQGREHSHAREARPAEHGKGVDRRRRRR